MLKKRGSYENDDPTSNPEVFLTLWLYSQEIKKNSFSYTATEPPGVTVDL